MKKQLLGITLLIAITSIINAQNYSGGSGTLTDPYQIANKADLKYLSDYSSEWNKCFIQTADIMFNSADFASTGAFYYGGAGFRPIAYGHNNAFFGKYNGNNHKIDGLYINRPSQNYIGLFAAIHGTIADTAIRCLGLTNANIIGYDTVGGIAGYNIATISHCYFSGAINGNENVGGLVGFLADGAIYSSHNNGSVSGNQKVGGLAGYNGSTSFISNDYNSGSINGTQSAGGLAGYNDGSINYSYNTGNVNGQTDIGGLVGLNGSTSVGNCYNIGSVSGQTEVGGLAGLNSPGSFFNCYSSGTVSGSTLVGGLMGNDYGVNSNNFWNTNIYLTDNSASGATGQTTSQMQTQATFTGAGWDFVNETTNGTAGVWTMGTCNSNGSSYPILTWQVFSGGGEGTVANPFIIATKNDLKSLSDNSCFLNKNFVQTAHIVFSSADFASTGAFYYGGAGFSPIGNFSGTYNGNNYRIDGLYVNRPTQDYIGLFGYVAAAGTLSHIACTNVNITGRNVVGGLAGNNDGTITNSHSSGTVHAQSQMGGGLVGENWNSISNCYSNCSLTGSEMLGGLVGVNNTGTVSTCYSNGSVSGSSNSMGGLVGNQSSGTISNSYSRGSVSGPDKTGGLVGFNDGPISNSYSSGSVNGSTNVGGLIGIYFSGPITNSFWDTQTSGQATSSAGTGKTTFQMQTQATFTGATWDFTGETANGTNDIWQMNCATNNGYPVLSWHTLNVATSLTATTSATNVMCHAGNTGSATITVNNSTGALTYTWMPSGGNAATASNLFAGVYTVTSIDPTGCAISQTVTITEPASINVSTSTSGETITANATGVSYQWIDCINAHAAIAGSTSQSYTATTNGSYAVIISKGGCSDTSACITINTTGINHISGKAGINVFPNPTSGMFEVAGFETGTKLEVVNVIGQVVYSYLTTDTKTKIDVSGQTSGVYFIKTNNGYSYKLIKQD